VSERIGEGGMERERGRGREIGRERGEEGNKWEEG
jgi:hypothetical protein